MQSRLCIIYYGSLCIGGWCVWREGVDSNRNPAKTTLHWSPCSSMLEPLSPPGDPFSERSAGGRARPKDRSARQDHAYHRQGLVQVSL